MIGILLHFIKNLRELTQLTTEEIMPMMAEPKKKVSELIALWVQELNPVPPQEEYDVLSFLILKVDFAFNIALTKLVVFFILHVHVLLIGIFKFEFIRNIPTFILSFGPIGFSKFFSCSYCFCRSNFHAFAPF